MGTRSRGEGREDVSKTVSWVHEVMGEAEKMYPKQPLGYTTSSRRCI
ncbi:hypothetical protein [Bacillus sp. P14.5]|nr:hypothetical protein [Bacillus sp. P14.5]